jgi:hypothetical protein
VNKKSTKILSFKPEDLERKKGKKKARRIVAVVSISILKIPKKKIKSSFNFF